MHQDVTPIEENPIKQTLHHDIGTFTVLQEDGKYIYYFGSGLEVDVFDFTMVYAESMYTKYVIVTQTEIEYVMNTLRNSKPYVGDHDYR